MRRITSTDILIKRLKKKDSKAQREAFEIYVDFLFKVCYRYLLQKEKVEDILSQVFMKVFQNIHTTDIIEELKLKAWMKRIAINECLQEIRKNDLFANSLELYEDIQESGLEADQDLLEEELVQLVFELPLGYRTVFSLYVIEGYTHKEISEKLDITIGTSKSQLSKARKLLKATLTNLNDIQ